MRANDYKQLAAARLREYAGYTGEAFSLDGRHLPNALHLSSESGVKRLREWVNESYGVRDIGPGFTEWSGLYGFLDGLCEAERRREQREAESLLERAGIIEPAGPTE